MVCFLTYYLSFIYVLFQILGLAVVGIGAVFSFIFHFGTKEKHIPAPHVNGMTDSSALVPNCHMRWKDWLKEHQFFLVVLMCIDSLLYKI